MVSRENSCYNVLRRHGFLISYSGIPRGKITSKSKRGETFGQWRKRVLGANVRDVMVYAPTITAPQTRISTLQKSNGGEHIKRIFEAFGRFKDRKRTEAVTAAEEETYALCSTIPKDTLRDVLSSFNDTLEPSLSEFLNRFLNSKCEDIDTEALLKDLLRGYNQAVRKFRELKARQPEDAGTLLR